MTKNEQYEQFWRLHGRYSGLGRDVVKKIIQAYMDRIGTGGWWSHR